MLYPGCRHGLQLLMDYECTLLRAIAVDCGGDIESTTQLGIGHSDVGVVVYRERFNAQSGVCGQLLNRLEAPC